MKRFNPVGGIKPFGPPVFRDDPTFLKKEYAANLKGRSRFDPTLNLMQVHEVFIRIGISIFIHLALELFELIAGDMVSLFPPPS